MRKGAVKVNGVPFLIRGESLFMRSLTVAPEHQSLPLGPRADDPRTPTPKSRTPTPESCPIDPTSPDPDTGVQHQARLPRPALFNSKSRMFSEAGSSLRLSKSFFPAFDFSVYVPSMNACGYCCAIHLVVKRCLLLSCRQAGEFVHASSTVRPPKAERIFSALIAAEYCPASSAPLESSSSLFNCPIMVTP